MLLKLFKDNGMLVKMFEDGYRELYQYIMHEENLKLFEDHPEFAQCPWSFCVYSPEQVAKLLQTLQKEYDLPLLRETRNQELPMIEICEGNYNDIAQIPLTPDIDMEDLRDDWCLAWCKSHGLYATEIEDEAG